MHSVQVSTFSEWRDRARDFLIAGVPPTEIFWTSNTQSALDLAHACSPSATPPTPSFTISKFFLKLAQTCSCHRDPARWQLLYDVAWRLTHAEPNLLHYQTDPIMRRLRLMEKAVRRDIHKMHAFVRFREVVTDSGKMYVAWHRPDHFILKRGVPFFVARFGSMRWTILTPDASASWDGTALTYGPGVDASAAPGQDPLEEAWKTYYASIFNPARVKIKMMKQEMPVRHWATLPEAALIPTLLHQVPERLAAMEKMQPRSAAPLVPLGASWQEIKQAAQHCTACDLCSTATQTVFGEGPTTASIVLLGEQPGNEEDLQGRPFIGPAGQLLNRALNLAGLARESVYVTNVVKHFRFIQQKNFRMHQKPSGTHQRACRPWLEAEMDVIRPQTIVCLGVTAAQAVLGRAVTLAEVRGRELSSPWAPRVWITTHPSALLRMSDPQAQQQGFEEFVKDLRRASL